MTNQHTDSRADSEQGRKMSMNPQNPAPLHYPGWVYPKTDQKKKQKKQKRRSQKLPPGNPRGIPPRDPPKGSPGSPHRSPQGYPGGVSQTPRDFCDLMGCVDFVIVQGKQLHAYCHIDREINVKSREKTAFVLPL